MIDGYFVANAAISLLMLILGGVVILKSNREKLNQIFLGFCFSTGLWLMSNDLSNSRHLTHPALVVANHLVLFFSSLAIFLLAAFTVYFTASKFFLSKIRLLSILSVVVAITTLTPLAIKSVKFQKTASAIDFGPLGPLYFILLAINVGVICIALYQGIKNSVGQERQRILTVAWSFILMLAIIIALNAIVPLLTGSFNLTNLGPLAVIILAVGISYSMVKHKLFDIRSFVIRGAAYFLAFSVLALLYVVPSVVLTSRVLDVHLTSSAYFVLVVITLVTSLLFQPLRLNFNKVTNRFFYRDYYEPQDVLDQISSLLVGSVDLNQIQRQSTDILKNNLKLTTFRYFLFIQPTADDQLLTQLSKTKGIINVDELSAAKHQELITAMKAQDIALAVRLSTRHEDLGFMLLGYKQSGSSYSGGDIKFLSIVADEIAIGLQNALRFEEIRRFNLTLEQKVDDATKKLRHANVRLKELDATKDEFISMASHQLRTPLTTIKGYLSMVLDGDMGKVKKEQHEVLQQAFDSAQRMVYLIADLLNVSRLQTGKFVIENHPTNLADVVEGEIRQLHEQAATRNIVLAYDKPSGIPLLNLDETKIRQVIMNFLDNALYYTPTGGKVLAELKATKETISFTVTDTGVGVPKEVQHHLFSKFYRAENAKKMRPDGTGLGLYMAKKVVVAQGGAIIFKSEEGKGSTFGFSFPRSKTEVDH